jgi:hypothetical protein
MFLYVFEVKQIVFLGLIPKFGVTWAAKVNTVVQKPGFIRLVILFI